MEKKRNITYDYLKGIAMLSIVIGHLYFYSGRHVGSIIFSICDTIELPVFLYISGLLAHVSVDRYGFRKLIASKVIRLLFPLFSFYLIWSLWDTSNFLAFWLKEFKNGYWFMLVLFELMVTLSSIKQFSIRFNIKTIYVTIVVYALATLVFFLLPKDGLISRLFCVKLYWHYFPFFMMGYFSYKLDKFMVMKYVPIYLILYLVAFYFYLDMSWSIIRSMACNLFSLCFLISVFSTSFKPLEKVFATVGVNSLQVYMVHFFLLLPLASILPVVENKWLEFPYFVVIASAIIFASIAIAKLLMMSRWLSMFLFGNRLMETKMKL